MKNMGIWLLLYVKRYLKRPGYILTFVFIPVLIFLLSAMEQQSNSAITVAYYMPHEPFLVQLSEELQSRESRITFLPYTTEAKVREAVLKKEVDCGYVFAEHFAQKLWEIDGRKTIRMYTGADETVSYLANEILYNEIFQCFTNYNYVNYIEEKFGKEQVAKGQEVFQNRMADGSTFSIVYVGNMIESIQEEKEEKILPVRGLLALFLMLAALCGLLEFKRDEELGRLVWVRRKWCVRILSIGVFTGFASLPALVCLQQTGNWQGIGTELSALCFYLIILLGFCTLWEKICGTEHRIAVSVPLLIIASILFAPIFWDFKAIIPVLSFLEKGLPVTWYLGLF